MSGCVAIWPRADGVVLDSRTNQPVSGALVSVECLKSYNWHNVSVIDRFNATTDASGTFRLSMADLRRCGGVGVHVSKEGYAETAAIDQRYTPTHTPELPAKLYLTPQDAVIVQRVESDYSGWVPPMNNYPGPRHARTFDRFFCASVIARTDREWAYFKDRFCEDTIEVEHRLTDVERQQLDGREVHCDLYPGAPVLHIDLSRVRAVCKQPNPPLQRTGYAGR